MTTTANKPQPFFYWVGGKRKLTDQLIERIPHSLNNYYEPFLGGGALFFAIKDRFNQCFLSDINLELITSYNAVKKNPHVINSIFEQHRQNHNKEYYYQVRNNNNSNDPTSITARFLYLNKYSFKGIYRINKNGKLNMSFSTKKYGTANIDQKLQQCSSLLSDTLIYAMDFSFIEPKENDFVYLDPPYHQTGERFYTRLSFDEKEQIRLRDFAKELTSKGVKLMISNSDTDFIRRIYQDFTINTIDIEAISSIFPATIVQLCIVHMVRNSVKYVSYKDLKEVTSDLKQIYTANNEEMARLKLQQFSVKWDKKYPVISDIWQRSWSGIIPFFAFPEEIRKVIYTTNTIESINRQIRKIIKNKGVFPDDKSIQKIIFLALQNAAKKWTMPIKDWSLALNQFEILCGDFKYDLLENKK